MQYSLRGDGAWCLHHSFVLCLSLHIAPCNAAICSLLVAWSSNCCIAGSIFIQKFALKEAAAKTHGFSPPAQFMWTTIGFTEKLSADFIPTELTYM